MSVLQYPDGISPKDIQIWNNAAFDSHCDREQRKPFSTIITPFDSLESFSSKENRSPSSASLGFDSSVSFVNPINPTGILKDSNVVNSSDVRDEKDIDKEIEEIETEINRLASRLQLLRIEKGQKSVKVPDKRGKLVSAKFMEQKHNPEEKKKVEENIPMSLKSKVNRRGFSLGPVEIAGGSRKVSKQLGKQDFLTTPIQPMQNRRKSCFWKLEDIDEEKVCKGKGKLELTRQAVTSIGVKKFVKIGDGIVSSVQPKKLFGDISSKKQVKQGRVIPSRYNQISSYPSSAVRKRSLPENDKDDSRICEKKRSLSGEKKLKNLESESRIKKRWEIPSEIVIHGSYDEDDDDDEKSPPGSISVMRDLLPKLRVGRCLRESPRDSGPAKKVAQLTAKNSFFSSDEQPPLCQALSFADEETSL